MSLRRRGSGHPVPEAGPGAASEFVDRIPLPPPRRVAPGPCELLELRGNGAVG